MTRDDLRDLLLIVCLAAHAAGALLARHQHRCADARFDQLLAHASDSAIRQGWLLERTCPR